MATQQQQRGIQIPNTPLSFEEFLAWHDEDVHAEWVDGEVIVLAFPSRKHQRTVKFLAHLLDTYLYFRPVGEVFIAPYPMKFTVGDRQISREPDLFYVETARLELDRTTYFNGPADLAIEIVSPDSVGRDLGEKFGEYEAAGIREYWAIDPRRRSAEFYHLTVEGVYARLAPDQAGWVASQVLPGLKVKVDWLWQEAPPAPPEIVQAVEQMLSE